MARERSTDPLGRWLRALDLMSRARSLLPDGDLVGAGSFVPPESQVPSGSTALRVWEEAARSEHGHDWRGCAQESTCGDGPG